MFRKILIANRGEIAYRIMRTCKEMGIRTVAVYSAADEDAPYLRFADETVAIGGIKSAESYLDMKTLLQVAIQYECQAVHPGYGFLAENPLFARLCEQQKTTFIGPPASAIAAMGDKITARKTMAACGLHPIPGSDSELTNQQEALEIAERIGYPLILKARAGGGGKGMRTCHSAAELQSAFEQAALEAEKAFGNGALYLEKYIEKAKHIEFQILADAYGNVIHLGERECSVQRNHQKLLEESPSPVMTPEKRKQLGNRVREAIKQIGYRNAGTVEFLLDQSGSMYFMEMNTRLQVEHPVTEMMTGLDLVKEQICIAANHPLSLQQEAVSFAGHAIECRINAENPFSGFKGSPGTITKIEYPSGLGQPGCRFDSHIEQNTVIPPYYDSMIGKLVVHGMTRAEALAKMSHALSEIKIEGIHTTIPLHQKLILTSEFQAGTYTTEFLETVLHKLMEREDG